MRSGIAFPHRQPHEAVHLRPLMQRLGDVTVLPRHPPKVAVHAASQAPLRGAWNVQVFHGLGDKAYSLNPMFLQRGRLPRARTALNMLWHAVGAEGPFLRAPARPGQRRSRYQQLNAYGPRFRDAIASMVRGAEVSLYGHVVLNDRPELAPDPRGPVVWLPTWDNERYMGGVAQSGLGPFAPEVVAASQSVPFRVKVHPLTAAHHQHERERRELDAAPGVQMLEGRLSAYDALRGARAVLTDTSSVGFEAYCLGFPVAVARPPAYRPAGMHAELEQRVPVLQPGELEAWAQRPPPPADRAWAEDLLAPPDSRRNDAFARHLRERL